MAVDQIKAAVDAGNRVHWVNAGYVVIRDRAGQYLICYMPTGHCVGLTNAAGDRLNGAPDQFYVA